MSAKRITFRCRSSTFRALLDSISEHFTEEVVDILRILHIHQFIRMPATQQDSTAITLLMSYWNIEKQAFYIGGHYLPFTADEVALMIGMPNRGKKVTWQKFSLSKSNSICFKKKIEKLNRPLSATQFVQLYIQFLISNLFFIYHNYRVASDLISYADNIDKFADYNWPEAIRSFLVSQFDMITSKILTQKAPGYMSGFVTLLMIWFSEHTRVLSPTVPFAKPRMLRWLKIKFTEESISGLQEDQVFQSFEDITEDETWLLQTVSSISQSSHIDTHRSSSPSPRSEAPIESPYISPRYSPPSYASSPPFATTPLGSDEKNEILLLIKALGDRLSYFEATITQKLDDIDVRLTVIEARISGQKNPNMGEAAQEACTGVATEATHPEVSLETTLMKDEQLIVYKGPTSEIDVAQPSMGSIARSVKARQVRKRKIVSSSFTRVYRKTRSTSKLVVVTTPDAERVEEGHHEMKRSFPWKTVDFISLSDSDSDSEGDRQDRAKCGKKDYSSKNLKDFTSEGALIRMAGMYQDYMKRTPIPTFGGSVIPFTSWQGLAKSLKQLYGQPLHYLTNRLLKQWDRERFGSDDEHQPLDAVVHPLKAQTLIWLTEELHRLTASPHHLAELWASDPMYHSLIDPFLSC